MLFQVSSCQVGMDHVKEFRSCYIRLCQVG
jgi:hypothetical protein